jgi:hypothetical protein
MFLVPPLLSCCNKRLLCPTSVVLEKGWTRWARSSTCSGSRRKSSVRGEEVGDEVYDLESRLLATCTRT